MLINKTNFILKQEDLTKEVVDAIVNAANSRLCGGGGVDGAIHRAGGPEILEQCQVIFQKQGKCPPGQAVITLGGKLPARYVIHTVGPIWRGGVNQEAEVLRMAYLNSLSLGADHGIKSIAFPSISTGAYGYPIELACSVALQACRDYAEAYETYDEICFVLFSEKDLDVYRRWLEEFL
jgi:O-acetyl-ADP-ribose deacetylase